MKKLISLVGVFIMLISSVTCYAADKTRNMTVDEGSTLSYGANGRVIDVPSDVEEYCHIIVNDYYDGENHVRIDKVYTSDFDLRICKDGIQFSALRYLDKHFYDGNGIIKKDGRKAVNITSSLGENDYYDTVRFDYFTSNEVEITYTYEESDCVITVQNEFYSIDYENGRKYTDKIMPEEYYSFKEGEAYEINAIDTDKYVLLGKSSINGVADTNDKTIRFIYLRKL